MPILKSSPLLSDYQEYTLGSDPTNPDTDSDGQSDYDEWVHELVPPSIATRSNRYFTASIYHNFFITVPGLHRNGENKKKKYGR